MGALADIECESLARLARYSPATAEAFAAGDAEKASGPIEWPRRIDQALRDLREGGRARRNAVITSLAAADIRTPPGTHAAHRLGYYRDKYAEDTTITLPIFPGMTDENLDRVVANLASATRKSI